MNASICMESPSSARVPPLPSTRPATQHLAAVRTTQCSTCSIREHCLPNGLNATEAAHADGLIQIRKHIKRGESLYRSGDSFRSLYAVRNGFIKTSAITKDGHEQITGFHMLGDIIGVDGIGTESHSLTAIALEDSQVCVIQLSRLEAISSQVPKLQRELHRAMSREIVRDQVMMVMLGNMRAEERVAAFLLNLSQRFALRGYSSTEFLLRMRREEIGSYLGLTIETISRVFSKFQESGLIEVQNRNVRILDIERLRQVATATTLQ